MADPGNTAPTDLLHDLTTALVKGTSRETLYYGVDTPIAPDAYAYRPTGPIAVENNTWEVLSWGYDADQVPFAILYETEAYLQTSASLDFISRRAEGIAKTTYEELLRCVRALGNKELNALLANETLTPQNGEGNGTPYPSCNTTCMTNGMWNSQPPDNGMRHGKRKC